MTPDSINLSLPPEQNEIPLSQAVVHLHPRDEVGLAKDILHPGVLLRTEGDDGTVATIVIGQIIPAGHKVALANIAAGAPVHRYGQMIGIARNPIHPGEHVHTHNLDFPALAAEREVDQVQTQLPEQLATEARTFMGYRRTNGLVGTRNYVAVISTVDCSAHVTKEIAHHFTPDKLATFANVDGVVPFTHNTGCSIRVGGPEYRSLQACLAGVARHPNVGAFILVGLGCEVNQIEGLINSHDLGESAGMPVTSLSIQDLGGIRKTVGTGIEAILRLLPLVDAVERSPQALGSLKLALQCGGSDGWSGVTANPLVGIVVDEIIRQGGTAVLAETPEIYGAEHLLTSRALNSNVTEKLLAQLRWWEVHTRQFGTEIDNNPTPGNKAGGLTNIVEKALGAVAKGGRSPLTAVYDYAEAVTAAGLTFMDSPGNDTISVTGQVSGGCNLVLFTTGRGSVFGFKPAPSIKLATNSATYQRMSDDMDLNAGRLLEGEGMDELAREFLELVIHVASGQPSKSEKQGVGESEFNPWRYGETV